MHRSISFAFVSAIAIPSIGLLAGCGKAPSTDTPSATASANSAPNPSTAAVTQAASNFLDAVIKGDTQRAGACLTPQAMQRIIASGKPFAPQGMENATFRVGEVRTPAVDKAFVHCVVTDTTGGNTQSEDMCCLMKLVGTEWRVSGIAYWGANQSGTMSDFETGQSMPIPRMTPGQNTAGQPATTTPPGTGTLPPRVATEPAATSPF
jgi:hypothetical protein